MTPYTTKKTGTGLGLPIVTKIVNEHSGNFFIGKKNQGKGTNYYIVTEIKCIKILVIDDNPDIRSIVKYTKRSKF